jgi:hypothetical protein
VNPRATAWLAWSIWVFCAILTALALILIVLNGSGPNAEYGSSLTAAAIALALLGFPTVGAVVASRRPGNAIGWLFCVVGFFSQVGIFSEQYVIYALLTNPGSLPGAQAFAAGLAWGPYAPVVAVIAVFLLLLFPGGRLPSRRWLPIPWLAAAFVVLAMVSNGLFPGPIAIGQLSVENPVGIEAAAGVLGVMRALAGVCLLVSGIAALTSLILRFRSARQIERQQLKWFIFAVALVTAALTAAEFGFDALIAPAFIAVPTAIGIAILRYRLYDIDVVINRTLVYGSLTATLVALYLGAIGVLQWLFIFLTGQKSTLAVVASTLVIAALFNPLRRRIQAFIDRRFYRSKYDASKTLIQFGSKLRNKTDLDALSYELVAVVRETMHPEHVSFWLRSETSRRVSRQTSSSVHPSS